MKVAIILMKFPVPRETFASNDINTLNQLGVDLNIYCLRRKHPEAQNLIIQRHHEDLHINHNQPVNIIQNLLLIIKKSKYFVDLVSFIIRYSYRKPIHLFKSLILIPRVIEIFEEIKKIKPDIVHLYWSHYPSLVGFLVKKYIDQSKVTLTFIAYDLAMRYGPGIRFAQDADFVYTIAKIDIPTIINFRINPEKIKAVYHGIKREFINLERTAKVKNRIITAGALIKDKKIDDVIRVFAKIKQSLPDASLVILGNGPEMGKLQNLAKSLKLTEINFRGHISHDEVLKDMIKADVFLFISQHNERLPNVVKEAIAARCYCVISDTTGIEELVIDGVCGSIVPQGDIEAAVQTIIEIMKNRGIMISRIENAHDHLVQNFVIENTMGEYISVWNNLMISNQLKDSL